MSNNPFRNRINSQPPSEPSPRPISTNPFLDNTELNIMSNGTSYPTAIDNAADLFVSPGYSEAKQYTYTTTSLPWQSRTTCPNFSQLDRVKPILGRADLNLVRTIPSELSLDHLDLDTKSPCQKKNREDYNPDHVQNSMYSPILPTRTTVTVSDDHDAIQRAQSVTKLGLWTKRSDEDETENAEPEILGELEANLQSQTRSSMSSIS